MAGLTPVTTGVMDVALARPRDRLAVSEHPTYVYARAGVIEFLYARRAA